MKFRPIRKSDYAVLLELDKKIYPTDSPVTPAILDNWYMRNPEFGLVYEVDGVIKGLCVAIPLNADGWSRLVKGQLAESELDSETVFDKNRDSELCIHVYHIEKLDDSIQDFHMTALYDLASVVQQMKKSKSDLHVVGFSGLCVTAVSAYLAFNKLNCFESYECNEHILSKDGKLILVKSDDPAVIKNKLSEGYIYVTSCKMMATTPDRFSPIWQYLP